MNPSLQKNWNFLRYVPDMMYAPGAKICPKTEKSNFLDKALMHLKGKKIKVTPHLNLYLKEIPDL